MEEGQVGESRSRIWTPFLQFIFRPGNLFLPIVAEPWPRGPTKFMDGWREKSIRWSSPMGMFRHTSFRRWKFAKRTRFAIEFPAPFATGACWVYWMVASRTSDNPTPGRRPLFAAG